MPDSKHTFRNYVNVRLEQVAQATRKTADQVYRREFGMDIYHMRILRIVSESPGRSVSWVVREAVLDRTLVSRIVTALERRGLLTRSISPDDARQFLLSTTPSGERVVAQSYVLGDALNQDVLGVLDQDELEVFERCLTKLSQWKPKS